MGTYIKTSDKNITSSDYKQIDKWLEEYIRATKPSKRRKYKALIVTKMLPVVKRIAHTIARRSYDPVDDLIQAGSIGVIRAVENFSFEHETEFRIYAGHLIIGEMKHFLRDKLRAIKVPRYVQELIYRITKFTESLTRDELSELTSYDIATAMNIPTQKVDFALMVERRTSVISIEELIRVNKKSNYTFEEIMPYENYKEKSEIEEIRFILDNVIKYLPDDCKEIVQLYYYDDMAQNTIAETLNLTPMTVSRKLKKAFNLLYEMIADDELHRAEDADSTFEIEDKEE